MKQIFLIVSLAFALLGAPVAQANLITFTTSMSGALEAPPNDSLGTGTGKLTFNTDLHTMRVEINFSGLTGTTTAVHIHCCTALAGEGTVGVATQLPSFTGFPLGVTSGAYDHIFDMALTSSYSSGFLTANGGTAPAAETALINGLLAGKAYLNIHSTFRPGGEIRGFYAVSVPEPATLTLLGIGLVLLGVGFVCRRRVG